MDVLARTSVRPAISCVSACCVQAERGVGSLFAGLGPSLLSTVPFVGVSWSAFTAGKAKTVKAIRVSRMFGNRISPDPDVIDAKGKAVKYYQPQHSQDDEAEADWLYSMGQRLMAASQAPPLGAV